MGEFLSGLYSFKGRLGRLGFLGRYIFIYVAVIIGSFIAGAASGIVSSFSPTLGIIAIILTILFVISISLIPPIAITAKRLHDIGLSGWWQLTPIIAIIAMIISMVSSLGGSFSNLTTLNSLNPMMMNEMFSSLGAIGTIGAAIIVLFGLMLLLYPGTKEPNKYDYGGSFDYSGRKKVQNTSSGLNHKFLINFIEEVPEDSLYLFKHLKENTTGITKISVPKDRMSASVVVTNVSGLNQKKIKKLFTEVGITVKSTFKES